MHNIHTEHESLPTRLHRGESPVRETHTHTHRTQIPAYQSALWQVTGQENTHTHMEHESLPTRLHCGESLVRETHTHTQNNSLPTRQHYSSVIRAGKHFTSIHGAYAFLLWCISTCDWHKANLPNFGCQNTLDFWLDHWLVASYNHDLLNTIHQVIINRWSSALPCV